MSFARLGHLQPGRKISARVKGKRQYARGPNPRTTGSEERPPEARRSDWNHPPADDKSPCWKGDQTRTRKFASRLSSGTPVRQLFSSHSSKPSAQESTLWTTCQFSPPRASTCGSERAMTARRVPPTSYRRLARASPRTYRASTSRCCRHPHFGATISLHHAGSNAPAWLTQSRHWHRPRVGKGIRERDIIGLTISVTPTLQPARQCCVLNGLPRRGKREKRASFRK